MAHDRYRMGYHLMPNIGWLNDPNGCCQIGGVYHVYHQHSPHWPHDDAADRGWGHAWSRDLVHWEHEGQVIASGEGADRDGAWSGSALRTTDGLAFYYTGNVNVPDGDRATGSERQQNVLLIETLDGFELGERRLLMTNDDYPAHCTRHVRDPYVWRQADPAGDLHMVLGARDVHNIGFALVYDSADGLTWTHRRDVRTAHPLGYMWECPNRIALTDATGMEHEFLAICPQGLPAFPDRWQCHDNAGYLPLPAPLKDVDIIDEQGFVEWDHGFDFYAPQVLVDESGRTLLFGWMGNFAEQYYSALPGMDWIGCLTVPRVLSLGENGRIRQNPAPELELLHDGELEVTLGTSEALVTAPDHRADIMLTNIDGPFQVDLDDALHLAFDGSVASLFFSYVTHVGAGRTRHDCSSGPIHTLRILVDSSCVEIFANDGEDAFATRWFPTADSLTLRCPSSFSIQAHHMSDGMCATYNEK